VSGADQAGETYLGKALAADLFKTAEFNLEQGQIDAVKEAADYEAAVDASFAATVGG
jgi:ABC-type taurine transport system substrate-binding protein